MSNPTEAFSYDAVGNRDSWMHNELNQLLSDNYKYNFEYNVNGEMTKRTNLKTGEVTNYSWSARGELERITITDQINQLKKEITFKYDGLGRRIEKMVVNTTSPEKSYTRKYFYNGQNIVEEKNASNQTVATYLHTLGIDDPVLMERNNEAYVYTKDGLGSIKELTKFNGKVIQRYRYSAYGEITRELLENRPNKDLVENSYTYTGREFEEETGLYYYRARYYDAELGRFISEDPIGFDGGVNFYNYVENNPMNWIDPSGLARCLYKKKKQKLSCTSNNGTEQYETEAFSGSGPEDAIMNEDYKIREAEGRPSNFFSLSRGFLLDKAYMLGVPVRGGFMIHPGTVSNGCITVPRTNKRAMEQYDKIQNMIKEEINDSSLRVVN